MGLEYRAFMNRLRSLADEITQNSDFEPVVDIERPFTAEEFSDLEDEIAQKIIEDVTIWHEFREFYSLANGFLFQWLYQGGEYVSTKLGGAQIAGVQQIYVPEWLPPGRENLFFGQRRVFDDISEEYKVTVRFERGSDAPLLEYFSVESDRYFPLKLDLSGYLDALLEARAMYCWQQFFIDDPSFPVKAEDAEKFRLSLRTIFSNADTDRFKAPSER